MPISKPGVPNRWGCEAGPTVAPGIRDPDGTRVEIYVILSPDKRAQIDRLLI